MGEFLYVDRSSYVARLVNRQVCPEACGDWAGDRIVCIGDYAGDLPDGVLTAAEAEEVNKTGRLYHHAKRHYKAIDEETDSYQNFRLPKDEEWVMRNLTKKQYIREKSLNAIDSRRWESDEPPSFSIILHLHLLWSDEGVPMVGHVDVDGPWAGDRIDIDILERVEGVEGWTDISEEAKERILRAII